MSRNRLAGGLLGKSATVAGKQEVTRHKGERGKSRIRTMAVAVNSQFHSSTEYIAKNMQGYIDTHTKSGAVCITKNVGTIANLKCPLEQRRSIAAILARKYRKQSAELSALADAARRAILDDTAVNRIYTLLEKVTQCKYAKG